ncbi:MAG: arylsulfatase [Chloroflexi bacterium]|nr:arylsulfatase [Chloroflexota bacterium]
MPDRPNILLILTDQQRGDCLGLAGHPVLQTPNMDFLGGTGAFFRRGYSEAPTCIPARRTLMSGQAPAVHGMVGMIGGQKWDPQHTLAGELSRAGYQTEMIGKLHLSPPRKRYGFDHMQLADSTRGANNDYLRWLDGEWPKDRWAMAHGVTPNGWIGRPSHLPETQTHAFWCVSRAIEFLDTRDPEAPFFLNLSFIDPHPPFTPPTFFYDRYVAKDLPQPVIGDWAPTFETVTRGADPEVMLNRRARLDGDTMHYCRAAYYGLINHVDSQLGRLFQYLRDSKLLDNTFILFTADHGEMLGDHHMFSKARAFEGSARVPFLVRASRGLGCRAGTTVDLPVGLQDVMPTLLDVAEVPIPETVTGRSVLPLMRGEVPAGGWRDVLHGEHSKKYFDEESMHYLTDGRMKYVWYSQTGDELLFDLDRDPQELHNLLFEPDAAAHVAPWHRRLIRELRGRPEGFTDGDRLIAGRPHDYLVPGPFRPV